jgi:phospho-N-acetylmuramoyl-pentapeptide-transferase
MEEASSLKFKILTGKNLFLSLFLFLLAVLILSERLTLLLPWSVSGLGVVLLGMVLVPWLRQLKAGQVIREDGPQSHLQKAGTPTMGGIFVVPVALVSALAWTKLDQATIPCVLLTLGFSFVGWLDDWLILRFKSNKGISAPLKLFLLGITSIVFCAWSIWRGYPTTVDLPFGLSLSLGFAFWFLALFVLLGTSNATNLTDGLDGLAGGTGSIAALGLGLLLAPEQQALSIFCLCISGAYLGFLWHNHNPARVFMGDTGSLALGGALAAAAILGGQLWGLLVLSLLFVWESLSTILQVSYYKMTKDEEGKGKRLFKMAPFHHHLELSGWSELQVVGSFYTIGLVLLAGAILLKT